MSHRSPPPQARRARGRRNYGDTGGSQASSVDSSSDNDRFLSIAPHSRAARHYLEAIEDLERKSSLRSMGSARMKTSATPDGIPIAEILRGGQVTSSFRNRRNGFGSNSFPNAGLRQQFLYGQQQDKYGYDSTGSDGSRGSLSSGAQSTVSAMNPSSARRRRVDGSSRLANPAVDRYGSAPPNYPTDYIRDTKRNRRAYQMMKRFDGGDELAGNGSGRESDSINDSYSERRQGREPGISSGMRYSRSASLAGSRSESKRGRPPSEASMRKYEQREIALEDEQRTKWIERCSEYRRRLVQAARTNGKGPNGNNNNSSHNNNASHPVHPVLADPCLGQEAERRATKNEKEEQRIWLKEAKILMSKGVPDSMHDVRRELKNLGLADSLKKLPVPPVPADPNEPARECPAILTSYGIAEDGRDLDEISQSSKSSVEQRTAGGGEVNHEKQFRLYRHKLEARARSYRDLASELKIAEKLASLRMQIANLPRDLVDNNKKDNSNRRVGLGTYSARANQRELGYDSEVAIAACEELLVAVNDDYVVSDEYVDLNAKLTMALLQVGAIPPLEALEFKAYDSPNPRRLVQEYRTPMKSALITDRAGRKAWKPIFLPTFQQAHEEPYEVVLRGTLLECHPVNGHLRRTRY